MKKMMYSVLIIFTIFITGCNNQQQTVVDVDALVTEAEQYEQNNDYTNAISTYEKVLSTSNDSKYQSKIDELKIKKEKNQKDIELVNQTIDELKGVLFNPDSLQVNEVIIYKDGNWASIYMDYSAMNGMGGFNRDYAYASFMNETLTEGGFFPEFESNYRSALERVNKDGETYYFDLNLIGEGE